MKILFGTVVYKQAWKWWEQFVDSVNQQSYHNFDILVMNDGLDEEEIDCLTEKFNHQYFIYDITDKLSISNIRIRLLMKAKELGYDLLILGDFDDVFSKNRVEKIVNSYNKDIAFYYHNLKYDSCDKDVFETLPEFTSDIKQILEFNYLGLSNTAINLKSFNIDFFSNLEDVKTNVFDWYLFSKILLSHKSGTRINTYTIYRQQENNIAGIIKKDLESIKKEIIIKKEHYKLLSKDLPEADKLLDFYQNISEDKMLEYTNNNESGYWWSNLKTDI